MVRPGRDRLGGQPRDHVEIDESWVGGRTRGEILTGAMPETLIGRVDVLYELLKAIDFARPEILQPYLAALTTDFERRPLAEQIIDQLLAEDSQRYETYEQLRAHVDQQEHLHSEPVQMAIGRFIASWIQVERLVHELT
jgi:hypothetical protein